MIIPMARIRVLGPRDLLDETIRAVQDAGVMHIAEIPLQEGIRAALVNERHDRRRRQVHRVLEDINRVLRGNLSVPANSTGPAPTVAQLAEWARLSRRERLAAEAWESRQAALNEEQALLTRYRDFLEAVQPLVRKVSQSPHLASRIVVVPAGRRAAIDTLAEHLAHEVGEEFMVSQRPLVGGDVAVLLVLPRDYSDRLDARLAEARVPEIAVPHEFRNLTLEQAIPRMIARLQEIPAQLAEGRRLYERRHLRVRETLVLARQRINDWLAEAGALEKCAFTPHAFALEGWVPARGFEEFGQRLNHNVGASVVVEMLRRESWSADDAPVVLANPRFFRPFEAIIALMPLPRYGSIDPTPYVAIFFPMLFGLMLGDVGYGLLLAGIAYLLHRRSRAGSVARTIAEIAGPCAAFAIVFGLLFGEFFGDIPERLFGARYVIFDRTHAIVGVLAVSVGLGFVHVVLGLILGAISRVHDSPRHALGKSVSALMMLLVAAALLAVFKVLPARLFTPAIVALLVAFPVLIATEGFIAPMEFLATLGNVLSYARIMAIGTASVMLAVIANQMIGLVGSTAIGFLFALLFHLVNFGIGLFTPAIHALRLHYVEFFGKFYSPGGHRYAPLGHWKPTPGR